MIGVIYRSLSWYWLFCYLLFQFIMLLLLTLLLCTSTFPFTHTLIRSLLTILNLHIQILDVLCSCSGVHWACTLCEELEFLSFGSGILISRVFLLFSDSRYISDSVFISVLFIWYHAWMLIYDIAVIVDLLWFRFITYSGYLKLSTYAWGIFLAYMRRRLSSRLRFHVFWEAGRDSY